MACEFLELVLITHDSQESFLVEWIEIEGPTGTFTVGYNHEPIISAMESQGSLKYKKQSEAIVVLNVKGGIFTLQNNRAIVLLD